MLDLASIQSPSLPLSLYHHDLPCKVDDWCQREGEIDGQREGGESTTILQPRERTVKEK
jgi:hypothetical protein